MRGEIEHASSHTHVRYMQGPEVPGRPKDASSCSCIMQDIAASVNLAETLTMPGEIGDSEDIVKGLDVTEGL